MLTAADQILLKKLIEGQTAGMEGLAVAAKKLREDGYTIAATNGCFDIIHSGHIKLLSYAATQADLLFVGVNSDAAVKLLKGPNRPINNELDRANVIAAIRYVDVVVIFNDVTATQFLEAVRPHVWVKGGDYTLSTLDKSEKKAVLGCGGKIRLPKALNGYSTTAIEKQLRGS